MLFDSGTPSLYSYTADMAGDPTTAPSPMWTEQQVKDAINARYLMLREAMRMKARGHQNKRTYATSVADQLYYANPADLAGKLVLVEIEPDGKDLSSDTTAAPIILKPFESKEALHGEVTGVVTETKYVFRHDQHFGVVTPPSTGGSNALRITYEAVTTELSADGDEPDLPRQFHRLLCYQAAIELKTQKDYDTSGLERLMAPDLLVFHRNVNEVFEDPDHQIPVAGLQRRNFRVPFGRMRKS